VGRTHPSISGRNGEVAAQNQVAVAVAGRAEVGRAVAEQALDKPGRMDEVRIGVVAAEVRQRRAVNDRPARASAIAYSVTLLFFFYYDCPMLL